MKPIGSEQDMTSSDFRRATEHRPRLDVMAVTHTGVCPYEGLPTDLGVFQRELGLGLMSATPTQTVHVSPKQDDFGQDHRMLRRESGTRLGKASQ